jgi:hypothetical protein
MSEFLFANAEGQEKAEEDGDDDAPQAPTCTQPFHQSPQAAAWDDESVRCHLYSHTSSCDWL